MQSVQKVSADSGLNPVLGVHLLREMSSAGMKIHGLQLHKLRVCAQFNLFQFLVMSPSLQSLLV